MLIQIGAILVIVSLLVWFVFRLNDVVSMSDRELGAIVVLGSVLMLPELLYQRCLKVQGLFLKHQEEVVILLTSIPLAANFSLISSFFIPEGVLKSSNVAERACGVGARTCNP